MRRVMILLVVGVLAIAAAGCGGSDESSGTDTTTAAETTTEDTTTEATETETDTDTATETDTETDTDASGSGSFASGDCVDLVKSSQELTQALSSLGSGSGDLKDSARLFQEFVDKAPGEIKADLQIMADAFIKYADVLGDVDLKSGETPSAADLAKLQEAAQSIDTAKVTAASQRLSAWAQKNCPNSG